MYVVVSKDVYYYTIHCATNTRTNTVLTVIEQKPPQCKCSLQIVRADRRGIDACERVSWCLSRCLLCSLRDRCSVAVLGRSEHGCVGGAEVRDYTGLSPRAP